MFTFHFKLLHPVSPRKGQFLAESRYHNPFSASNITLLFPLYIGMHTVTFIYGPFRKCRLWCVASNIPWSSLKQQIEHHDWRCSGPVTLTGHMTRLSSHFIIIIFFLHYTVIHFYCALPATHFQSHHL